MRVLITGADGQLGHDLVEVFLDKRDEIYGLDHQALDVTDEKQTKLVIREIKPHVVIHTAAYTAVDKAEEAYEKAYMVNAQGTKNVARAADSVGSKLCYIGTDYVFDGTSKAPYSEDAPTNPINVYGQTKLIGEKLARVSCERTFIVRTSWVFGKYGSNFVKTILNLAKNKDLLRVVNDQFGSPTYTRDLCSFIYELIQTDRYGIYHASNRGSCSWYEFAQSILNQSKLFAELKPCKSEEFPRQAPRPAYSVLAHEAVQRNGFKLLRPWDEALEEFLKEISKNNN